MIFSLFLFCLTMTNQALVMLHCLWTFPEHTHTHTYKVTSDRWQCFLNTCTECVYSHQHKKQITTSLKHLLINKCMRFPSLILICMLDRELISNRLFYEWSVAVFLMSSVETHLLTRNSCGVMNGLVVSISIWHFCLSLLWMWRRWGWLPSVH